MSTKLHPTAISAIAARCRSKNKHTLGAIHEIAKEHLRINRLSREVANRVRVEIRRQDQLQRKKPRRVDTAPVPMIERWCRERERWIARIASQVILTSEHYHTNRSAHGDAGHTVTAEAAPNGEVSAQTTRDVGGWTKYGRRGYYPSHFDWRTKIVVAERWLTKIKVLGTAAVQGMLVLDVVGALRTPSMPRSFVRNLAG